MIDCYETGDAKSNEKLNELLRKHAVERRVFVQEIMDEDLIADELRAEQVKAIYSGDVSQQDIKHQDSKKIKWCYPALATVAAGVAVVAVGMHFLPKENLDLTGNTASPQQLDVEHTAIAKIITASTDAQWEELMQVGEELGSAQYRLVKGAAHIEFSNGVGLSLSAPAEFKIKDAFNIVLNEGKVRAHVPTSGYGFRIDTPNIDIRDLGTEFGLSVTQGGETKVNVFNGEIELYTATNAQPIQATEGYAATWKKGESEIALLSPEAEYPTFRSIALQRWKEYREKQLADPSLLLYLDFKNGGEIISSHVNESLSAETTNVVKVRGRWEQDSAYVIESLEQKITLPELNLEGDFSIQAWIYTDVFETSIRVIMNTEEEGLGRLHWQISRDGKVSPGFKVKKDSKIGKLELGTWHQVTLTYDAGSQLMKSYVNGEFQGESKRKVKSLNLTRASVGAWQNERHTARVIFGKIDEFSVVSRELSKAEIKESYEVGSPY